MKIIRNQWIITAVFLFTVIGCQNARPKDSNEKWGHLNQDSFERELISVLPNQTISVCSEPYDKELIKKTMKAINAWAEVIDRKNHLVLVESCPWDSTSDAVVKVFTDYDHPNCDSPQKFGFSYTWPQSSKRTEKGQFFTYQMKGGGITLCEPSQALPSLYAGILHEVGHLWGLCDQYPNSVRTFWKHNNNCSAKHRTFFYHPDSIMGIGPSEIFKQEELQSDDKAGIKKLSERGDIKANAVWGRFR